MRTFPLAIPLGLLATTLFVTGCPGTLDDIDRYRAAENGDGQTQSGTDACGDVETTVFASTCASAGCHAATGSAGGLDLASPDVRGRLSGQAAIGGPGILIDPASPDTSVLYTKLTTSPPFGSRMPLGAPLDEATIACVRAWVAGR